MDLREKKTRRSITNAFLQLRRQKPLERITIKELAELAEISKATFYLHYRDVYDLSDQLQNEVIQSVLCSIEHPESFLTDQKAFTAELFRAFHAQQSLIGILFSGAQSGVLPMRIELEIRSFIHKIQPEMDKMQDMFLTYSIQGGHAVFQKFHKTYSVEEMTDCLGNMANAIAEISSLS